MILRIKFTLLLFSFLPLTNLGAQIKIHQKLTVEDGLVQSQVLCIYEDRQGYLWFGTFDGLSRWDGIAFTNFQFQNGSVPTEYLAISEDNNGALCFGTSTGFTIYRDGKFTTLDEKNGLVNEVVRVIHKNKDGKLYLGTDAGVDVYANGKFEHLNSQLGFAHEIITAIHEGKDGTLYVGTHGSGVSIHRNGEITRWNEQSGLASNIVRAICESSNGTIYIGTDRGLNVYQEGKLTKLLDKNGWLDDRINAIRAGQDGTLYLGTFRYGVILYKNGAFSRLSKENGLAANRIFAIYEDQAGAIYFGTDGGVSIYKAGKFETWNEQTGLLDNLVWSIREGKDGKFYFGTQSGVSIYHNGKFKALTEKEGLVYGQVRCFHERKDGTIYFGAGGGGVSVYQNGQVKTLAIGKHFVMSIYEDGKGTIYLATAGDGVHIYKNGKFSKFTWNHELASAEILSINGTQDGMIYFGTTKGVSICKDGGFKTLSTQDGLANNFVWHIFPSNDGTVYFGTGGGLSIYKNGKFETIDVRRGLSNNTVLGILEDDAGKIYVSTNKGINVLDFSSGETKIRTIRHQDGLPSDECVLGACYKDGRGRLWFGTVKGVICYDPEKDRPNPIPPKVHLAQLRLFDREIPLNDANSKLVFQHDENYFKFDFIGIDLQARGKVTYRHRLSGVDKNWMETQQRSVQYTNLNDGKYRFEVKAMNEWGYWSEPATLAFAIQPPFWERWWFIAVMTLSIGGALAYLITLRVRQLLAIERLRTRIAADLHDNIGAGLTEISILSEVGTKQIARYPQNGVAENFGKISQISRALVDRMNDIVWLVNPRRDSLYDLIQQLGSSFEEISTCSGMVFRALNLEVLRKVRLSMDYRQQLFHIFKEALNNSLKHSAAREVILEAQMQGKRLHMRLKDDGKGFDGEKLSNGNGLENMKRRAEMIGGKLEVHSTIGEGTLIEFNGKIS